MKELINKIQDLRERALRTWGLLDLDTVAVQLKSLEQEMSAGDFWLDQARAQKASKQAADLRAELGEWEGFLENLEELEELAKMVELEDNNELGDELHAKYDEYEKKFSKMEFATLFCGKHDEANAIVAIHAGSGGTEAQDWTQMLYRMYTRFTEAREWGVEIIHESRAEDVGLKSIMFRVTGRYAYGYLKSEHGVHRLVRISPFDAEKMRHTTFALVEVLPEFDDLDAVQIDEKDLRVDTYMAGGHGGQSVNTTYSAVRVVHIPTGITVTCQNERSQKQNKETALKILKAKLDKLQLLEQEEEKKDLRGDYQSAEWGNQIRSYVLHPYKMVKDHRSEYETQDAQNVLEGDLEGFMEAYLRWELEQSDRFEKANEE
ncbi:MAG: peptide chain release factor 2 [Patescibacteria group bacterium]